MNNATINVSELIASDLNMKGLHTTKEMIEGVIKETVAQMIASNPQVLTDIMAMITAAKEQENKQLRQRNRLLQQTVSDLTQQVNVSTSRMSSMNEQLEQAINGTNTQKATPEMTQEQKRFSQETANLKDILEQIAFAKTKKTPKNEELLKEILSMTEPTKQAQPKIALEDDCVKFLNELFNGGEGFGLSDIFQALNQEQMPKTKAETLKKELEKFGIEVVDIPMSWDLKPQDCLGRPDMAIAFKLNN